MTTQSPRSTDQRGGNGANLGPKRAGAYADIPGFCKAATFAEIQGHGYVLTPDRYVGVAEAKPDAEPFTVKMQRLSATLNQQFAEAERWSSSFAQVCAGLAMA